MVFVIMELVQVCYRTFLFSSCGHHQDVIVIMEFGLCYAMLSLALASIHMVVVIMELVLGVMESLCCLRQCGHHHYGAWGVSIQVIYSLDALWYYKCSAGLGSFVVLVITQPLVASGFSSTGPA